MSANELIQRGCPKLSGDASAAISCGSGCSGKLNITDWLNDIPFDARQNNLVEIRFKNTRKGIYHNVHELELQKGDIVAVESSPGHDIGVVSLVGELVHLQLSKYHNGSIQDLPKVYRKAKPTDIEKWQSAIALENQTMIRTRAIAKDLKLDMKIGDVEYQGDKTKAIFYYIADERVDFRQLIKVLAEEFRIRVEMKQIGARQEAGRIGGIGPCGRELCCSTFITSFVSVSTTAARVQELSLNPQKLAGQCGKLKCCLNYEVDTYLDARADFPSTEVALNTDKGPAYHFKTDVFRGVMWYNLGRDESNNILPIGVERVQEIIKLNKKGTAVKIDDIVLEPTKPTTEVGYSNVIGEESLTRFDDQKGSRPKKKRKKNNRQQNKNRPNDPNKKTDA